MCLPVYLQELLPFLNQNITTFIKSGQASAYLTGNDDVFRQVNIQTNVLFLITCRQGATLKKTERDDGWTLILRFNSQHATRNSKLEFTEDLAAR